MTQKDAAGLGLSYLATDAAFSAVKDLERRNALIPVVGNFAGPKAIRAVGTYLRDHQATVAVLRRRSRGHLRQDGVWPAFCANAATLPLDGASVFIRPPVEGSVVGHASGAPAVDPLVPISPEVKACSAGR